MKFIRIITWLFVIVALTCIASGLTQAATPGSTGGIVLPGTRIIYPGNNTGDLGFTLQNNTSHVYLLQSRILPWSNSTATIENNETDRNEQKAQDLTGVNSVKSTADAMPFMVLPPLTRFNPQETLALRIKKLNNTLPEDRESVFMLSLNAIPGQPADADKNTAADTKIVLALQNNFKLFYRPAGLPVMDGQVRSQKLKFTIHADKLKVNNPTPYFITLGSLSLGSKAISLNEQRMIAPYQDIQLPITGDKQGEVRWQIIDDDGRMTQEQREILSLNT